MFEIDPRQLTAPPTEGPAQVRFRYRGVGDQGFYIDVQSRQGISRRVGGGRHGSWKIEERYEIEIKWWRSAAR